MKIVNSAGLGGAAVGGAPSVPDRNGSLSKSEITDERFVSLFERADKNTDGIVSRDELAVEAAAAAQDHDEGLGPEVRGHEERPGEPRREVRH